MYGKEWDHVESPVEFSGSEKGKELVQECNADVKTFILRLPSEKRKSRQRNVYLYSDSKDYKVCRYGSSIRIDS